MESDNQNKKTPALAGVFTFSIKPCRMLSEVSMAEREGFEPPIALRLCLISSQVHSTGLCHLSAYIQFTLNVASE